MRSASPLLVALLLVSAPACSDDGGTTGVQPTASATTSTSSTTGTTTGEPTTGASTNTTGTTEPGTTTTGPGTTAITSTTGTTEPDTGSTTDDPNCPPVKGAYNDCTDDQGDIDNKACGWMGDGENGFITCLNAGGMMGASTCSLVNCELDCHCFDAPATGTATSVCRANATDKGDSACVLDCSRGATCPDGMVCDNDTCFWPAP